MFAMISPVPRGLALWRARCAAGAVLLLFAVAAPLRPAGADTDAFSATVTVDATAGDVAKARDVARTDGQRKALMAVIDRLSGGGGSAKLPKLGDNQITDMVASFEVANEKMTAVRYAADYTYHFRSGDVKSLMAKAGVSTAPTDASATPGSSSGAPPALAPAADTGVKPVVVLPVLQTGGMSVLWDDPNPWRQAWQQRAAGGRLLVPLGDLGDVGTIDADQAQQGDPAALAAITKKYNSDEGLLLVAVARGGDKTGLDVTAKRYRGGQLVDTHSDAIDANPGEKDSDFYRRAAAAIAADIDGGWKNAKQPTGPLGSLVAVLPITGLDDWIKLRDRVSTLPDIRKIEVQSLSRQEATLNIQYVGTLDQLKATLATINLDLQGGDPAWRLARAGGDQH